ncbi:CBS domain-containing protein [Treponema primitia]|uniref:CBS and ACT domain-containing protein n=1 Tax=Treponema primitia TaxID=88058 RepID=UPI00397F5689
MIISRVMTKNPITVHPDMSVTDVRSLMDKEQIGHLPVLDKNNNLVGILTKKDLLKAGPSGATSLDMYEISYLLSKLKVEKIMVKDVITVEENDVVEEAARVMADKDIGCLPVMKGDLLVGIITETDLFHVFVKAFGARHPGVRITLHVAEKPGQLEKLTHAIAVKGGNIIALVSSEGDDLDHRRITIRIAGMNRSDIEESVNAISGAELEDIR